MYIEGEVPNIVSTTGCNGNNGFGFGNGWEGLIGLALVAGLFGGWGNGGFGIGGNRGGYGYGGIGENYVLATDFATIERKLDGVNNGLCDGFYAQNTNMLNGFANVQNALCQGFSGVNSTIVNNGYETRNAINNGFAGVNNAICTLGYNQASLVNGLSRELADCCCSTKTAIADVKYSNERNTCQIIEAINRGNQRLVDIYTNDKIDALRTENASLRGQISNDRQSRFIIDELRNGGCPIPSYVVQPSQPVTFPTDCCGNVNYASYNKGCGCC